MLSNLTNLFNLNYSSLDKRNAAQSHNIVVPKVSWQRKGKFFFSQRDVKAKSDSAKAEYCGADINIDNAIIFCIRVKT